MFATEMMPEGLPNRFKQLSGSRGQIQFGHYWSGPFDDVAHGLPSAEPLRPAAEGFGVGCPPGIGT